MSEATAGQKIFVISGMLFFGTATTIFRKLIYDQRAVGDPKYGGMHNFNKPWFLTVNMFVGMALALFAYEIELYIKRRKDKKSKIDNSQLLDQIGQNSKKESSFKELFFLIAAPSVCDILATILGNIGLLFIEASVWQMLRGSMVIFSTIFSHFILKRYHMAYKWWSVFIVVSALIIVGLGAVLELGVGKAGVSEGKVIFSIFITIIAQVFQASEIVLNDFILHEKTASPIMTVGIEGLWGTLICAGLFMPIAHYAFQNMDDGNGIHEDTWDSFLMLKENPTLVLFNILYLLINLAKNLMAMYVIKVTSAVMRTIVEGLRTLFIWVFQVIMYYSMLGTAVGNHHPDLGEEWNKWSWMELGGFALLFTGMLTYNRILILPGFKYEDKDNKQLENPLISKEPTSDPLLEQVMKNST